MEINEKQPVDLLKGKKWHKVSLVAVILLFILIGGGLYLKSLDKDLSEPAEVKSEVKSEIKSENAPVVRPVFSADIFDVNKVSHITPLGELNGGYEEAQTIGGVMVNIKSSVIENGQEMEVFAPADMTLENYSYHKVDAEPPSWSLTFRFNNDLTMKLDHITKATSKIVEATTSTPKGDSRTESPQKAVSFKAGETIAYTSGTSKAHNWNIYFNDQTNANQFINQVRYEKSYIGKVLISAVCPFDYYEDTKKSAYLSLMGKSQAGQSRGCGTVSKDVKGALSGMWHLKNEGIEASYDGRYATPLSIYKNSANEVIIYEINKKWYSLDQKNRTYKDPASITDSHCYELTDVWGSSSGYAFFKIKSDIEMLLNYATGSCPSQFPESGSVNYYR